MTLVFVDMPGARPWPPRVSAFTKPLTSPVETMNGFPPPWSAMLLFDWT